MVSARDEFDDAPAAGTHGACCLRVTGCHWLLVTRCGWSIVTCHSSLVLSHIVNHKPHTNRYWILDTGCWIKARRAVCCPLHLAKRIGQSAWRKKLIAHSIQLLRVTGCQWSLVSSDSCSCSCHGQRTTDHGQRALAHFRHLLFLHCVRAHQPVGVY